MLFKGPNVNNWDAEVNVTFYGTTFDAFTRSFKRSLTIKVGVITIN